MKILVLTNLYPPHYLGGYELICEAVTNALRKRGHELTILTSNHIREGMSASAEPGIERRLRIHGLYGHPWLGIFELSKLESHNNRTLRHIVERVQPNLVYVWNMGGLSKSMLFTLEQLHLPVAYYLSDHWIARAADADVWLRWWNRADGSFQHRLLRGASTLMGVRRYVSKMVPTESFNALHFRRIYFCSRALRKLTASAGLDVMHGSVIYCPVDIARFRGPPKLESEPLRQWLWVGRLAPDKGIMTALGAIKLLAGKLNGTLDVYGSGETDYVLEIKRYARQHSLPVEFRSASATEMPGVYRSHDALLFTSEWAEPFALTPLEAMATGLPVIGTTTGGSRELFRHEDNALTYAAGNSEELAARILQLSADSALRARIAATGQKEVRANYSESVIVDQIEHFLNETVLDWNAPSRVGPHEEMTGTLINTPLQRGVSKPAELNRFNGFLRARETVETVPIASAVMNTLLKEGPEPVYAETESKSAAP